MSLILTRHSLQETSCYPHFIGSWHLQDLGICDGLINYFEHHQGQQRPGIAGSGYLRLDIKDSVDMPIAPLELLSDNSELFKSYFEHLFLFYGDYIKQWPFLEDLFDSLEIGSFNLQRYMPGQHFKKVHTERAGLSSLHRLFAFMTYLNDVEEGGATCFSHYGLEIKPQKGLTLLWPAEWTHAHCGNPVVRGSKYIITGWLNFHE